MRRTSRATRVLVVLGALLPGALVPLGTGTAGAAVCATVLPGDDLRAAVLANPCVNVAPGTYPLDSQLTVPTGHDIYGQGLTRADVRIVPSAVYQSNGQPNLLLYRATPGTDTSPSQISELRNVTLDGRKPAGGLLGALVMGGGWAIDNVGFHHTECYGLGIQNYRTTVRNSLFENNGASCGVEPPGGAIWVNDPALGVANWAPVIEDNTFQYNTGPAVDSSGVWYGQFRRNVVRNNRGYAGFALFGSSYWTVEDNQISHAATEPGYAQTVGNCHKGAYDRTKPAGILLCQKSDENNKVTAHNTIRNNRTSSYWGILLVGNDETKPYWAPRKNTLTGNTTTGSNVGCADDFRPGQWYGDDNHWSGNSCTVTYF